MFLQLPQKFLLSSEDFFKIVSSAIYSLAPFLPSRDSTSENNFSSFLFLTFLLFVAICDYIHQFLEMERKKDREREKGGREANGEENILYVMFPSKDFCSC